MFKLERDEQFSNARASIEVAVAGIVMLNNETQFLKAFWGIVDIIPRLWTVDKLAQSSNALSPRLESLWESVTFFTEEFENALIPTILGYH